MKKNDVEKPKGGSSLEDFAKFIVEQIIAITQPYVQPQLFPLIEPLVKELFSLQIIIKIKEHRLAELEALNKRLDENPTTLDPKNEAAKTKLSLVKKFQEALKEILSLENIFELVSIALSKIPDEQYKQLCDVIEKNPQSKITRKNMEKMMLEVMRKGFKKVYGDGDGRRDEFYCNELGKNSSAVSKIVEHIAKRFSHIVNERVEEIKGLGEESILFQVKAFGVKSFLVEDVLSRFFVEKHKILRAFLELNDSASHKILSEKVKEIKAMPNDTPHKKFDDAYNKAIDEILVGLRQDTPGCFKQRPMKKGPVLETQLKQEGQPQDGDKNRNKANTEKPKKTSTSFSDISSSPNTKKDIQDRAAAYLKNAQGGMGNK